MVMTLHEFIFSKQKHRRTARHFAFWGLFSLVLFFNSIEIVEGWHDLTLMRTYEMALLQVALFLPCNVFLVYIFIYFLIPKFIEKKQYVSFAVWAVCALVSCLVFNIFPSYLFLHIFSPGTDNVNLQLEAFRFSYGMSIFFGVG